jgi:hypothetical protein
MGEARGEIRRWRPSLIRKCLRGLPTPVRTAEEVVSFAGQQLEADHGGNVLLRRGRKLESMAATDQLVLCADSLQADLDEGPCQDIGHNGKALTVPNLRSDSPLATLGTQDRRPWPHQHAGRLFTTSEGRPTGSINLYWGPAADL